MDENENVVDEGATLAPAEDVEETVDEVAEDVEEASPALDEADEEVADDAGDSEAVPA